MLIVTQKDFEDFLERISVAFLRPEFALWRDSVLLPFTMVTKEGPVTLRSIAALEDNFRQYLLAVEAMALDGVYREPLSLENCHDGTWIGTYKTHLLSQNQHATAPYVSSALLKPGADGVRMISILNARGHHAWVGEHPLHARYGPDEDPPEG